MKSSLAISVVTTLLAFLTIASPAVADDDGHIYLNAKDAPKPAKLKDPKGGEHMGDYGDYPPFQLVPGAYNPKGDVVFQRAIADWLDPFTLPHSRADCSSWASGHIPFDGDWKTCVGWTVHWQYHYNRLNLLVSTSAPGDISGAIDSCLQTAAVIAILAGVSTGGSAVVPSFEGAMTTCLASKLSLISAKAWIDGYWGNWG